MTVESGALACGRLPSSFSIDSIDDESEAIERSLAARDASLDHATIAPIDM